MATNRFQRIVVADGQYLTESGWIGLIGHSLFSDCRVVLVDSKRGLIEELANDPFVLVILDFASIDFSSPEELSILLDRFPMAVWMLCSNEFSDGLLVQISAKLAVSVSVVYKESRRYEFDRLFDAIAKGGSYTSSTIIEHLSKRSQVVTPSVPLSETERAILSLLAQGYSSKEIAAKRSISAHTVMTHRKNIFRKIGVNNVFEATKYALRAGLVELSDYYI